MNPMLENQIRTRASKLIDPDTTDVNEFVIASVDRHSLLLELDNVRMVAIFLEKALRGKGAYEMNPEEGYTPAQIGILKNVRDAVILELKKEEEAKADVKPTTTKSIRKAR